MSGDMADIQTADQLDPYWDGEDGEDGGTGQGPLDNPMPNDVRKLIIQRLELRDRERERNDTKD